MGIDDSSEIKVHADHEESTRLRISICIATASDRDNKKNK